MRHRFSRVRTIAMLGLAAMLALPAMAQEGEGTEAGKPPVRVRIVKPGEAPRSARRIPVRLVLPGSEGSSVAAPGPDAAPATTAGRTDGAVDIVIDASTPVAGTAAPAPRGRAARDAGPVAPSLFDQLVAPAWSGGGGFDRAPWPEETEPGSANDVSRTTTRQGGRATGGATPASVRESAPAEIMRGTEPGSLAPVAGDDYRLGPGDRIDVFVWRNPDLSRQVPVRPDGRITLPLAGEVVATGKTVAMLREEIAARLSDFIQMPTVTVTLAEIRSLVVYVLGDVRNPGAVQMDRNLTVLQAIAAAGGLTEFADRNDIVVMRTRPDGVHQRWTFRYDDVVRGKQLETNIVLQAGDTIIVP